MYPEFFKDVCVTLEGARYPAFIGSFENSAFCASQIFKNLFSREGEITL